MKTGTELIAEERARQISSEGWTAEHDDQHQRGELSHAAACYARLAGYQFSSKTVNENAAKQAPSRLWPWSDEWWKPADEPIRNLVKAGALIAAEIDRLQRASNSYSTT